MTEFKIIKEFSNPLLHRTEFLIEAVSENTPTKKQIMEFLKKPEQLSVVKKIKTQFGSTKFIADVVVYESEEKKKEIEPTTKKQRKKLKEEQIKARQEAKKQEQEKPAEQASKEQDSSEKTVEEKPEENKQNQETKSDKE